MVGVRFVAQATPNCSTGRPAGAAETSMVCDDGMGSEAVALPSRRKNSVASTSPRKDLHHGVLARDAAHRDAAGLFPVAIFAR